MSLSSRLITSEKAKKDILKTYKIWKLGFERFVEGRICSDTVSFYDSIKQNKLESFNARKRVKKRQPKRLR